jgi:hypothetical protein
MTDEYKIIEYRNPYRPMLQMYKCSIGNETLHAADLDTIIDWRIDQIQNKSEYDKIKKLSDTAIASFFRNTTTSKD